MNKKIIAIFMAFITLICFASCNKKEKSNKTEKTTSTTKKNAKEIKITVDINPSLEFVVDDANRVLSVKSDEDDVLNSIDYKNKSIDEVILLITNSLINNNKLNKDNIDILISSNSSNSSTISNIIKKLKKDASKSSINLNFFMITTDEKDAEILKIAQNHNISYGKAYFCNQIVKGSNGAIKIDEIIGKNITEIVAQAKDKGVDLTTFSSNLEKLNPQGSSNPSTTQKKSTTTTSKNTAKTTKPNKTTTPDKTTTNATTTTKPSTTQPTTPVSFWHTQPKYDFDLMWPADDVWIVKKDNKYGIMESSGKMTFALQEHEIVYVDWDITDDIDEKVIRLLKENEQSYVIDKYGNFVKIVEGGYGGYGIFNVYDITTKKVYECGTYYYSDGEKLLVGKERSSSGTYGVYMVKSISIKNETDTHGDTHNMMTIDTSYSTVSHFKYDGEEFGTHVGTAKIYKNGEILPQEYESILTSVDTKYFSVRADGKRYLVGLNGQKLYSTGFDAIANDFGCSLESMNCDYFNSENLAAVMVNGKWGFIKKTF